MNGYTSEDLYPYNSFHASLVKLRFQIRAELPEVLDPKDDREEDDRQTTLECSGGPFRNVALEEFEGIDGDNRCRRPSFRRWNCLIILRQFVPSVRVCCH